MPTTRATRILLIEDDAATLRLFDELLADGGFVMVGTDHDRLPTPDGFSLVVTDLPNRNLPYVSDSAVQWVRQLADRYRVPVIVLTGYSDAWLDPRLRAFADVITKPVDIEEFMRRVRAALECDRVS